MGIQRKIKVLKQAADNIADIAYYIESKGMLKTAERFSDDVYDFLEKIGDKRRVHKKCRDKSRSELGFKCISYKRKYTIVFIETSKEITICEFLPSKLIK